MKNRMQSFWPYLALSGLILLFYSGLFTFKGAWLVGDHAEQHYPWQWHLAHSLKQGALPFWTDLIHSGFPLIAEGQIGAFYPPNLFFAYSFPIEIGYALNIVAHLLVSAFFMRAYLKSLGLDNRSIFIGAFVYFFGSTLGGAYYNITCLKVMTWFPLTLILADRILNRRTPWVLAALALGVLFAFQILAGYLQFAVYAILFTGLYGVARFLALEEHRLSNFLAAGFCLLAAVGIAAILAFPQLHLTRELAFLSNRAQTSEEFAYVGSFSPFAVVCLLFPNFEGFFTGKLYLGVLPFFFIFAAFSRKSSRSRNTIAFLALLALLLALGRFSPLYVLIIKTLNFHSFRTPFKFIFFTGFFLSVLAAFGAQNVFKRDEGSTLVRDARVYLTFLVVIVAGVLGAYTVFHLFESQLTQLGENLLRKWFYGKPGHPFDWPHYQKRLEQLIDFGQWVLDPRSPTVFIPLIKIFAAGLWVWGLLRFHRFRNMLYLLAVGLLIADLQFSYSDIQGDYAPYAKFYKKNRTTEFLVRNLQTDSYFNYSDNPSDAPLPQAKNMIYGLRTANAYSPLVLKDYYDFLGPLGGVNDSIAFHPVSDLFLKSHLHLLEMLGVRYLITDRKVEDPVLEAVIQDGKWKVLENKMEVKRYRLVNHYEVIPDRGKLLEAVHAVDFDPAKTVLLEQAPSLEPAPQGLESGQVKVLQRGEENLEFEVETLENTFLVLGQVYYPGWEARIDGWPADILRANYVAQAIPIPPGKHRVSLWYNPWHSLKKNRLWRILTGTEPITKG